MGMPIVVELADKKCTPKDIDEVFDYFSYIDKTFSTYKKNSEISKINSGKLQEKDYSSDVKTVLLLCEKTKKETNGYFDIHKNGKIDPSGVVKGWAINNAAKILRKRGFKNFYINAGGDIQVSGTNAEGIVWTVGIQNPFNLMEIIKVLQVKNVGVATSGTYARGQHVYNPFKSDQNLNEIVSLTVIAKNIYEADRFATAAFAMQKEGIKFIAKIKGLEGYMIDRNGIATYTSGFNKFTQPVILKEVAL